MRAVTHSAADRPQVKVAERTRTWVTAGSGDGSLGSGATPRSGYSHFMIKFAGRSGFARIWKDLTLDADGDSVSGQPDGRPYYCEAQGRRQAGFRPSFGHARLKASFGRDR